MRRVVVFGAGGYLGRVLTARLRDRGDDVVAPTHGEVPIEDAQAVTDCIEACMPHVIINASAAQPDASPEKLQATNVDGALAVAQAARASGARLVHLSSDAVLPGSPEPFGEDAAPAPMNAYGKSKAEGERLVLTTADAVAIRTSLIWDPDEASFGIQVFTDRLANNERLMLFTDEFRCPITRTDLATAVIKLVDVRHVGVLNVAGDEILSRSEFARLLLEHYQVPGRERAEHLTHAEAGVKRPGRVVLDSSLAKRLLSMSFAGPREVLSKRVR